MMKECDIPICRAPLFDLQGVSQQMEKRRQYSLKMSTYCTVNSLSVALGADPSFHTRYASARSIIWRANLYSDVLMHWVQLQVSFISCLCLHQLIRKP